MAAATARYRVTVETTRGAVASTRELETAELAEAYLAGLVCGYWWRPAAAPAVGQVRVAFGDRLILERALEQLETADLEKVRKHRPPAALAAVG